MEITDRLIKQINETKYLNSENTKRYRPIIRYMLEEYEAIRYLLSESEIYEGLKQSPSFKDYTIDMLKSDLASLVEWGNLTATQDLSKVSSIEEFKNRKYIYELTDYAVQIARLEVTLESMSNSEGASLDPSLFEKIKVNIAEIKSSKDYSLSKVAGIWEELKSNFLRLNQKYQDYVKTFYSSKNDESLQSIKFIAKKNELIKYLKDFVSSMQINSYIIEEELRSLDKETEQSFLNKVYESQKNIVRLDLFRDATLDEDILKEKNISTWENIKVWFLGSLSKPSESSRIYNVTNEIIKKITKYAMQIAESKGAIASKKQDYKKVCEMFLNASSLEEASKLSSVIFGIEHIKHFEGDFTRLSDSANLGILEESPFVYIRKPRIRSYKEKTYKGEIENHSLEKEKMLKEYLLNKQKDNMLLEKYITNGKIAVEDLQNITSSVRIALLSFISKANERDNKTIKIDSSKELRVIFPTPYRECTITCEDGTFTLPAFVLEIT